MIKLKEIVKEAYIDPEDAGKSINYALDDLKLSLKTLVHLLQSCYISNVKKLNFFDPAVKILKKFFHSTIQI